MNNLYLNGTTITGSTNYALHASSLTGSELFNTHFENSGSYGVYITSGGVRLIGCRIKNNGFNGIHLSYANTLLMGGGGDRGYNVVTGNSGHGLYSYASSADLGFYYLPGELYAGYNSVYGNTGKDVYATNSSTIRAEENWWGESPPNTGHFYVSSNSSFDYTPWLSSDPNAGAGKAATYAASREVSERPSQAGQHQSASPFGRKAGTDAASAELSIGAFVGEVQVLREEHGRARAAAVLAEIAATPYHPMATVAQMLRLGDLLYLRRTQDAVAVGEALLLKRRDLDEEARKIIARALLAAYGEQLADEANAARMKGLLVRLGDLAARSGTLAPDIEAAGYADEDEAGKTAGAAEEGLRASSYPNPFNPEVTIHYDLPEEGQVRLRIFDVLGRQVATLVDEVQQAGRHQARFVASDLPSGVYLYRIEAAGQMKAGRLILQK